MVTRIKPKNPGFCISLCENPGFFLMRISSWVYPWTSYTWRNLRGRVRFVMQVIKVTITFIFKYMKYPYFYMKYPYFCWNMRNRGSYVRDGIDPTLKHGLQMNKIIETFWITAHTTVTPEREAFLTGYKDANCNNNTVANCNKYVRPNSGKHDFSVSLSRKLNKFN